MKRFVFYVLLLIAAVLIGISLVEDPGYVLITYHHWSVETTLWFFMMAQLLLTLLLYGIVRLFCASYALSGRIKNWMSKRQLQRARAQTDRGLCQLAEGNWSNAEKHLLRAAAHNENSLINYLAAAKSAQERGAFDKRDEYLRKAHESTPSAEVAIGLTQAQLQLSARQWEQALATLQHLNQIIPHHVYALKLLQKVYVELTDWHSLYKLLPELRRYHVLKPKELEQLEQQIYAVLLADAAKDELQQLDEIWRDIPLQLRKQPALIACYAEQLIATNNFTKAETLLRDALRKQWDRRLVTLYGNTPGENIDKQLSYAEKWLQTHNQDPELLLCLGRLCWRNQLWDKAKYYLENSITLEPSKGAYQTLGAVLEELDEPNSARICYRKGLQM